MSKAVKKVIKKVGKSLGVIKPVPKPTPAPVAAEPTVKETQATAREESKAVYDSAARRVRRGRAAGYRALMTDRSTLGGGGSTLG